MGERMVLWCSHEKVRNGAWAILIPDLTPQAAVDELVSRKDRVRRNGQPCRFKLLAPGEVPS